MLILTLVSIPWYSDDSSADTETLYHLYVEGDDSGDYFSIWLPQQTYSGPVSPEGFAYSLVSGMQSVDGDAEVAGSWLQSVTYDGHVYESNGDWPDGPYWSFAMYYSDGTSWVIVDSYNESSTIAVVFAEYLFSEPDPSVADQYLDRGYYWIKKPSVSPLSFETEYSLSLNLDDGTHTYGIDLPAQFCPDTSASSYNLAVRGALWQASLPTTYSGETITKITVGGNDYVQNGTWGTDPYYGFYYVYNDSGVWKEATTFAESTSYTICLNKILFSAPDPGIASDYIDCGTYWLKIPTEFVDKARVSGTVTGTGDVLISGATVTLGETTVSTDSEGHYLISNLDSGTYDFTVSAGGYDDVVTTLTVGVGISITKNVSMVSTAPTISTVTGTVTDQYANPVQDATVNLGEHTVQTDADGNYQFTDVTEDMYSFSVSKSEFETVSLDLFVNNGITLVKNVTLSPKIIPPDVGDVKGTVQDANNVPLSGAQITLGDLSTTSDSTGSYTFKNVPEGSYTLTITLSDYVTHSETVSVVAGETSAITTTMSPPAPAPAPQKESQESIMWKNTAIAIAVIGVIAAIAFLAARKWGPKTIPTVAATASTARLSKAERFSSKSKGVDNSWISADRAQNGNTAKVNVLKTKTILTILLVVIAGLGVIVCNNLGVNATAYQSQGIVIDYGDYKTVWTDVDYDDPVNGTTNPLEMLDIACTQHQIAKTLDGEGKLFSVEYYDYLSRETISNNTTHTWGLWTVDYKGNATKSESYEIRASDYNVVIWAYTANDGGKPTIAVDSTNTSIYGYHQANRVVTLSPVATEIVSCVSGTSTIVGTDSFSDYPSSISASRASGNIATVGTYLSPSYESILDTNPDLVICDGSAGSHISMATKIRSSDINAVVLYDPSDVQSIYDNIFIVSAAMSYSTAATLISEMKDAINQIDTLISGSDKTTCVMALGVTSSPYVAGGDTYANNILTACNGQNVFGDMPGWPLITSEFIPINNPSLAFFLDAQYSVAEYDEMVANLSTTPWKDTDAFSNGKIYLFTEDMSSMAQRAGPRFVQLYEITARILNPDCFSDEAQDKLNATHAIGSDYKTYLKYTLGIGA